MLVRALILLFFFVLSIYNIYGQEMSNMRAKELILLSDTTVLDSFSLIPKSVKVFNKKGRKIDERFYEIDPVKSLFIVTQEPQNTLRTSSGIRIQYQVFPFSFTKDYKHKDIKKIEPDQSEVYNPFVYTLEKEERDVFNLGGLNKSGSISRGVSFGNNQDLSVNSNLDLQLSGKLSNEINILAAISDDNIPIQPEGNTQQLQEFDQVYIQLYNDNSKLTAGDFRINKPAGHFMYFNKRLQGGSFETQFIVKKEKNEANNGIMRAKASAAVSKGKFSRNTIIGIEGNQGPYRLTGAENELFIIIISGSERVYIDGKQMKRGQDLDYIIDYNSAEITFTANQIVTKDKRIIVEFQYSDRNYARSLIHVNNEYEKEKLKLRFNFYNEQDSKNQPLDIDISDAQKRSLAQIGDSLNQAIFPNFEIDTTGEFENQIRYKLVEDTLGGDTVFIYSINPDSAIYKVGFAFVGQGNGNYFQTSSLANGKVFEWIAPDPITGRRNGDYEPVTLITTPKQRQMVTFGGDYKISPTTQISFETALTKNDINTFSTRDDGDDYGYGYLVKLDNATPLSTSIAKPLVLKSGGSYEIVDKNFQEIERFRPVEFEREWNIVGRDLNRLIELNDDQQLIKAYTGISKIEKGFINYDVGSYINGGEYDGFRNGIQGMYTHQKYTLQYRGSVLNTKGLNSSRFLRQHAEVSKDLDWIRTGLIGEQERSDFKANGSDSLSPGSYEYQWWEAYITNSDSLSNSFRLSYRQREDLSPNSGGDRLKQITLAEDVNFTIELTKHPNHRFRGKVTYRSLKISDTTLTTIEPENTVLGKIDYGTSFFKKVISSNTYYEIGSGLEVKKEFSFIEVTPGQGNYYWSGDETDYNNNGIPELNEFEVAQFQDQGNYIKVFTPTNDFIKTFTNGFNQVIFIRPEVQWRTKTGLRKALSVFSNKAAYQINRKTQSEDDLYNPFLRSVEDSSLVNISSSFLNTFYINRTNPVFGADITYRENKSKTLLTSGFDSRENITNGIRLRWSISRKFSVENEYEEGTKSNFSEFFTNRNFSIDFQEIAPKISFQSGVTFRISLLFNYLEQKNQTQYGGERAFNRTAGMEFRYNVAAKGSFLANFNYISIIYNGDPRSSLAYEMLDALRPGENTTWNVSYQRNLSKNMQLSLNYNGRNSEDTKTIHAGGAQVRAFF